jgi:hypothetical protein
MSRKANAKYDAYDEDDYGYDDDDYGYDDGGGSYEPEPAAAAAAAADPYAPPPGYGPDLSDVEAGSHVAARFTEDSVWYPAVIDAVVGDGQQYTVTYTQFGNSETLGSDSVLAPSTATPSAAAVAAPTEAEAAAAPTAAAAAAAAASTPAALPAPAPAPAPPSAATSSTTSTMDDKRASAKAGREALKFDRVAAVGTASWCAGPKRFVVGCADAKLREMIEYACAEGHGPKKAHGAQVVSAADGSAIRAGQENLNVKWHDLHGTSPAAGHVRTLLGNALVSWHGRQRTVERGLEVPLKRCIEAYGSAAG